MKTLMKRLTPTGTEGFLNGPVLTAIAIFALYIHAHFVVVVSHPFFYTTHSFVLLLVPGIALSALAFHRVARDRKWSRIGFKGVIGLLVLPFCVLYLCWVIFAKTPAWTAAVLFGEAHAEVREFDIRVLGSTLRGCNHRAQVVDDLRLFPRSLCVSESFANEFHGKRVQLRLIGERTPLGFRISHYEYAPGSQVPPQ